MPRYRERIAWCCIDVNILALFRFVYICSVEIYNYIAIKAAFYKRADNIKADREHCSENPL